RLFLVRSDMSVQSWEHFFKPEVRSSGRALVNKGKLSISQPSDTEIVIYVRSSPSFKVSFKTPSIANQTVAVDCTCPAGKKGVLCKHIWAGLLATEEKNSDFFESKTKIEKLEPFSQIEEVAKPSAKGEARAASKAAYKAKQASYRKEQYQIQKQRLKDLKEKKKNPPRIVEYPSAIERALHFFSENGIELRASMNREAIGAAKKKLSRLFHPDAGGTHNEASELNRHSDILIKFLKR
ncbi:MAG: SWIM zinc finger domain-containing protein, partial [Pseudobdellovibrionaceae bacterium]